MADQLYRCSFHFNYSNEGYSETWWIRGSSLAGIFPKIDEYVTNRLAWQPTTVELGGVRVAVEGQSRKGRTLFAGRNHGETPTSADLTLSRRGSYILSGDLWDLNQLAIQTEVIFGGQKLGFRYFGILPDAVSGTGNDPLNMGAVPLWYTAWKAWRDSTLAGGWLTRITQAVVGGEGIVSRPEIPIKGWQRGAGADADWQIVVTGAAVPAGWATGARVVIRAARMKYSGVKSPNGTWYISELPTPTEAGTFIATLKGTAGLSLQYLANTGVVYLAGSTYVAPSNLAPYSVTKHKRGGPFPRTVGRVRRPRFPPS